MLAASRYITDLEKAPHPTAYELSKAAKGILSRTEDIARDRSAKELELWIHGLPSIHSLNAYVINLEDPKRSSMITEPIAKFAEQLTLEKPRLESRTANHIILGRLLIRQQKPVAKLLIETPLPPSPIVYFFTQYIWFRLLAAIIVSGLICFFMTKAITRPITALRKATQQLAEGKMDSRFDGGRPSNDEISQLGYDFNNMADRLQQTIEEQKQLVRDISHELRSPLGRIQVALALAQRKHGEDTAELLRVEKECERLNALIGQLLVVPNYNQNLDDCIDLVALLEDIARDDEPSAAQERKRIEVQTSFDELLITTAGNLLWHAVDNLARNALRHTPDGSTVALSLDRQGNDVRIIVRDQGSGVPDQELEKIFNPFYRVETARDHQDSGGHGLGLNIASRAIEHHGGKIEAGNIEGGFEVIILLPSSLLTSK